MAAAFAVQRLTADDVALHREVLALYAEVFDDPGSYASAPPGDDYLRELLGRRDFIQLAAVAGGEAVGALTGYVLQKFEQERAEIYIYDLAVLGPWRRQGIATALIAALGPIAQEAGAWVVYVQADFGDDPAIALYESLGTREEVLHFDLVVAVTPTDKGANLPEPRSAP